MPCSKCGGSRGPLARCGRCKWPRYCSKDCQRAHWSTHHRHECALLLSCAKFRDLERRFWADADRRSAQVLAAGLNPDSMRFYGEVLFLVLGLKACVVLSNLPPTWRASFSANVIAPSRLLSVATSQCSPRLVVVGARIVTPAEYELSGDLVLANEAHPAFRRAASALHLRRLLADPSQVAEQALELELAQIHASAGDAAHVVEEETLAQLLDYPVALSDCREPMVEVGYFLVSSEKSPDKEEERPELLASYCASAAVQAHSDRVRAHFERYRAQSLERAGVELAIQRAAI